MTELTELLGSIEAPSDPELISRVRGGDVDAYGALFARHVDAARRLARQLTQGGDSDDLVSDAFTKVMDVLSNGGGPDVAFRAYLLTAVRRLHLDRIRAQSRVTTSGDMELFDPGVPFRDTAVDQFESRAAARAFASLPERWQLVLWHLEVEGQKPAEVAPLLGMSANSVSALAYRAREGLRQAFLSAHLADTTEEECRWVNEHLGGYVRKGLAKRETARVREHLDGCRRCTAMYLELTEVNSDLRGIITPLLLGSVASAYAGACAGAGAGAGGAGAGGMLLLLGRAKDLLIAHLTPVAAGTTAAGVAVATAVTVTLSGPDTPGDAPGASPPGDISVAVPPGSGEPGERELRESLLAPGQRSKEAPVPALGSPPGEPMGNAVEDRLRPLEPLQSQPPGQPGIGPETEPPAGLPDGDVPVPDPPTDPSPDPSTDPSTEPPTDPPTDPSTDPTPDGLGADVSVSSVRISADDSLVVEVDGLPDQRVTVLVDLASSSGQTTFAAQTGACEVSEGNPLHAGCATGSASSLSAANDPSRRFRASLPLAFPDDLRQDRLRITVGLEGDRDPDPRDNVRSVRFKPHRPSSQEGRDLALTLASHAAPKGWGRFRVHVSDVAGGRNAGTPLHFELSFSDGRVGLVRLPRGCDYVDDQHARVACLSRGSSYSAVFDADLRGVPALEPVTLTMTVTIPGETDPRPADNTSSTTLRRLRDLPVPGGR